MFPLPDSPGGTTAESSMDKRATRGYAPLIAGERALVLVCETSEASAADQLITVFVVALGTGLFGIGLLAWCEIGGFRRTIVARGSKGSAPSDWHSGWRVYP